MWRDVRGSDQRARRSRKRTDRLLGVHMDSVTGQPQSVRACMCVRNPRVLVSLVQGVSMILIAEPSSFSNTNILCTQSKYMLAGCTNFSSRQIRTVVILLYMLVQMLMFNYLTINDTSLSG